MTVSSSRLSERSEAKESVHARTAASACGKRPLIRCVIAGSSLARPRLWTIGTQTPSARALGSVTCRALGL
eukprot:scaffold68268_cov76-Phaeocystis_antarctica.AAC.2